MNTFKALVSGVLFAASVVIFGLWSPLSLDVVAALVISGTLGLAIGDIFLLNAYIRMGAARTLILFGFQPLFLGAAAHWLFNQPMSGLRFLAILFFMACLFTFSLEKYRQEGHWEIRGLVFALVGVLFDNSGVLLSRWAFDQVPNMTAFQANLFRCSGAVFFFAVMALVRPIHFRSQWRALSPRARKLALVSAFLGTYLSLFLYLTAIKIGHLASISALGVAGPIITSAMECAYYQRAPSRYLLTALLFFMMGFALLMWI